MAKKKKKSFAEKVRLAKKETIDRNITIQYKEIPQQKIENAMQSKEITRQKIEFAEQLAIFAGVQKEYFIKNGLTLSEMRMVNRGNKNARISIEDSYMEGYYFVRYFNDLGRESHLLTDRKELRAFKSLDTLYKNIKTIGHASISIG